MSLPYRTMLPCDVVMRGLLAERGDKTDAGPVTPKAPKLVRRPPLLGVRHLKRSAPDTRDAIALHDACPPHLGSRGAVKNVFEHL